MSTDYSLHNFDGRLHNCQHTRYDFAEKYCVQSLAEGTNCGFLIATLQFHDHIIRTC